MVGAPQLLERWCQLEELKYKCQLGFGVPETCLWAVGAGAEALSWPGGRCGIHPRPRVEGASVGTGQKRKMVGMLPGQSEVF